MDSGFTFLSRRPAKPALVATLLLLLASATFAGSRACAQEPPPAPAAAPGQTPGADPFSGPIRPSDTLRVVVAGQGGEGLSGEFRVESDGSITMPRVGQVKVGALMQTRAAAEISRRIVDAKLLRRADVSVYIIGRKARIVTINGAVNKQGDVPLRDEMRLSEVVESAGPQAGADLVRVVVTRNGQDMTVNYQDYVTGKDRSDKANPKLEDRDKIYVYSGTVGGGTARVFGEVTKPSLMGFTVGTTVGQILQQAGGITDRADRAGIVIVRAGSRIPVPYDDIMKGVPGKDVPILDGDEINVPRLEKRREFTVAGAVIRPNAFPLETRVTLLEAVAQAGGPQDGARQKEVELRRRQNGQLVTIKYDLANDQQASTEIADGDYIFVPYARQRQRTDILAILGGIGTLVLILSQVRR